MVEGSRELFFIVIFQVSVTDSGNSKDHTDWRMLIVSFCEGLLSVLGSIYPRLSLGMKCTDVFPDFLLAPSEAYSPQGLLQTGSYNSWCFLLSNKNKQANCCSKFEFFVYIKQILVCKFDCEGCLKNIITQCMETNLHESLMFLASRGTIDFVLDYLSKDVCIANVLEDLLEQRARWLIAHCEKDSISLWDKGKTYSCPL